MYSSQVYVSIRIYGDDFHPPELTNIIGLSPTDSGVKGEKGEYVPALKECFWQYQLERTDALEDLDKSLEDLKADFERKIGLVKSYIKENDLCVKCYVVIEAENGEDNGVAFNPEFIGFLNELNASVEVDIYN